MGERKILGLIYGYNEEWIAGSYYIENLIACLQLIPVNQRPHIKVFVFNEDSHKALVQKDFYDNIDVIQVKDGQTFIDRIINKICFWFTGKYAIIKGFDQKVDAVFPNPDTFHFHQMPNHIAWIPDFQEKYFSEFFPKSELLRREKNHQKISKNSRQVLVLSSESARRDFEKFYPEKRSRNYVIPFAVTIPSLSGIDRQKVLTQYNLQDEFFICSNQFWAHKGHKTLLRAIRKVKDFGSGIKVVFTGKPHDNRNQDFFGELENMLSDLGISDCVRFLGFIPRADQLVLMEQSIAILQPSQFEGWSTVVEDAKILNKPIILSTLDVHLEQINESYEGFFEVNNADALADRMLAAVQGTIPSPNVNYRQSQTKFGLDIIALLKDVS